MNKEEKIFEVKIFKALSDPNRIRILKMLQVKELCVCEITSILKLATSTVSRHLSILKEVQLVVEKKNGKWINYSVNKNIKNPFLSSVNGMLNLWFEENVVIKKDRLLLNKVNRNIICEKNNNNK